MLSDISSITAIICYIPKPLMQNTHRHYKPVFLGGFLFILLNQWKYERLLYNAVI